jgi:hypothetical protein
LAAHHGVPFVACAPLVTFDPESATGGDLPLDERGAAELLWIGATRLAPADARAANPVADVTPAELVSAFVTEEGVLREPFAPALAAAAAASVAGRRLPEPAAAGGPPPEPAAAGRPPAAAPSVLSASRPEVADDAPAADQGVDDPVRPAAGCGEDR